MSEKIFALLLRLYPSRFRNKYGREALQLIKDRFRDESGSFKRIRLVWDLVADGLFGLPQAYRNSYASTETTSLSFDAEGIPSFRVLDKEPIGRGSILLGGAMSLSTIVAFGWLLSLSIAHLPAPGWNGHMSPIEAVVERLNQATPTETPLSESTSVATSERQPQTPLPAAASPSRSHATANLRGSGDVAEGMNRAVPIAKQSPSADTLYLPPRLAAGETVAWKGNLTDASGHPVRAADIHVIGGHGELVAHTAADGSFAFPEFPSGDYEIVIVRDGREVAYRKALHLGATSSPPRLTLAPGGRLVLSVR
jgi:hypothetical protein